jgi:hypothetical protein
MKGDERVGDVMGLEVRELWVQCYSSGSNRIRRTPVNTGHRVCNMYRWIYSKLFDSLLKADRSLDATCH